MKKLIGLAIFILVVGTFIRAPVSGGKLSSMWGLRFSVDRLFHPGSDIALPTGSPIRPILPGRVTTTDYNDRWGNYVYLSHYGVIQSRYLHLDAITVSPGEHVEYNTLIGTVGNTGLSTGPHLHFEIRVLAIPLPAYLLCLPGRIMQRLGLYGFIDGLMAK